MSDRFLRKSDIAAMLSTSECMAASFLKKYGCYPIDLGYGRGRGLRWLESAVINAMRLMHMEAQQVPKEKKEKIKYPKSELGMANMKAADLQTLLTRKDALQ